MKLDRLMGIVMILTRQGQATAPELAERFEVSRRTINRDIETLCKAGVPIVTIQGRGGGISIAQGYRVDHSLLTREELAAVLAGLQGVDSVSPTSYRAGLESKLGWAAGEDPVISIDLSSHYQDPLTQKLAVLKSAAVKRHLVSFRYYSEKGESLRQIEPYRLLFCWWDWYVWGWCLDRKDFRLFKLRRLWELTEEPRPFAPRPLPPEGPDPEGYFRKGTFHLKARFSKSEKYRLIEEYGPDCYQEESSGLLFERTFSGERHMLEWVLSFGKNVEVLEPKIFQIQLRQQAEGILSNYGKT